MTPDLWANEGFLHKHMFRLELENIVKKKVPFIVIAVENHLKDTNQGPNRYPDMIIDIPNYLETCGYFNSKSIPSTITLPPIR